MEKRMTRPWIWLWVLLLVGLIANHLQQHAEASPGSAGKPPYWTGMSYLNIDAPLDTSWTEKKRPDVTRSSATGRWIHVFVDEGYLDVDNGGLNTIRAKLYARRTTDTPGLWSSRRDSASSFPTATVFTADTPGIIEPVIATDSNGTWLIAFSTITLAGDRDIYVSRSNATGSNEGAIWSTPVLISSLPGDPEDGADDIDPHITYESISGTWIIAWTSYQNRNGSGSDADVMFVTSTNRGITFTAPSFLNPNFASDSRAETELRLFSPAAGVIQAAYRAYDSGANRYRIFTVKKNFGSGTAWSIETLLGPQVPGEDVKQFGTAVDQPNNVVVLVYTTIDQQVRYVVSVDGASSFGAAGTIVSSDDALDPVVETDGRGVFVAVWSSTIKSYYGAQDKKWFNVTSDREIFYSVATGQNGTGLGNGWNIPKPIDQRNMMQTGTATRPRIFVDSPRRAWVVLYESNKSQYFINTATSLTFERSDTDVFFSWWNVLQKELCWERSSSIAAYCMEALQDKVNASAKNATSWTSISVAGAYNPTISTLLSVIITEGRWISIQAELPGTDSMQMGNSCQYVPFFIIADSLSKFRFSKVGLRIINSPLLVDNRGSVPAANLQVQYDNSTGAASVWTWGVCWPYNTDFRCPAGFRPPDFTQGETMCMPCPAGSYCFSTAVQPYLAYYNSSYEVPCPVGSFCPAGGFSPIKCQSMRYYYPADPPMVRSSQCNTTGSACLPGYRCPSGAHVDNHTQVMTIDVSSFAETLVFPGERTVSFTVRNVRNLPNSRPLFYVTPSPIPAWMSIWVESGVWNPSYGQFSKFSAVLRSNVAGVSVSDLLQTTYVINIWDYYSETPNEPYAAPFVVSFTRQVTSVIFSPEDGIQMRVGLGDTGFNQSVFIFNIGCTDSVSYDASVWDCGHPDAPAITSAQGNSTLFPQDWVSVYSNYRNGSIRISSADPAEVRVFLDPSASVLQGGLLSTRLPASSTAVSRFGTVGTFTAKACVQVRFVMQTQGIPLIKNVPIELKMYENCPVGYYSPSGTSELGSCNPCQMGTYTDTTGTRACLACPESRPRSLPGARSLDECLTAPGSVRDVDGTTVDCQSLGDGVACNDEGIGIARVPLRPGYWRSDNKSKHIMKCIHPQYCVGGDGTKRPRGKDDRRRRRLQGNLTTPDYNVSGEVSYCLDHHLGALCEGCEPGYVRRGTNPCSICDEEALAADRVRLSWTIIAAIVLVVLAFIVVQRKQIFSFFYKAQRTAQEFRRGSIHAFTSVTRKSNLGHHPASHAKGSVVATPIAAVDTIPAQDPEKAGPTNVPVNDRSSRAASVDVGHNRRSKASTVGFAGDLENGEGGSDMRKRNASSYAREKSWAKNKMLNASMRMSQRFQVKERASYLYRIFTSMESSVTLRIMLSMFQVCSGISTTFLELFPPLFHQAVAILNVVSASIFYNIDFACVLTSNHYFSLILAIIVPFFAIMLIVVGHWVMERRLKRHRQLAEISQLRNKSFSLFLVLLFLVYPNVSNTILSTFACKNFDDGTSYLRKDLTIDCKAPGRDIWIGLAAFGTAVYVIGVPLVYLGALIRVRKHLLNHDPLSSKEDIESVEFLVEPYRKECWWYEVFELFRKLIQTSLLVFFLDGSVMQTMAMIAVSAVVIIIIYEMKPYKLEQANRLAAVAQWCILLIAFLGMLYKVDLAKLDAGFQYDKKTFLDVLVMITLFITPALAFYQKRAFVLSVAKMQYNSIRRVFRRWRDRITGCWEDTTELCAPCCGVAGACCWCCPKCSHGNDVVTVVDNEALGLPEAGGAPEAETIGNRVASSIVEQPIHQ